MGRKTYSRKLVIWMNGSRVADWIITASGGHQLVYDKDWIESDYSRPLSLSLPLQNPGIPHKGVIVESFFDNLLPDSIDIRKRIQSRFGIAKSAPFDLLEEIGRDCTGAVQLLPEGDIPVDIKMIEGVELSESEIAEKLLNVVSGRRISEYEADDFRISIAGAQEKSAFLYHDGKWKKPVGSTPTTHIFKLPLGYINNIDLKTSVENEWLCSEIIKKLDIPVANTEIKKFYDQKFLCVTRFDRKYTENNSWIIRLPQEDMCQAMGTSPGLKYENDGGPGIVDIMKLLLFSDNNQSDRTLFFKSQIVFWLLAAPDGHAKNFSIFLNQNGSFALTPLYDVMSAYPVLGNGSGKIPPQKLKMAMSVSGKNRHYKWKDFTAQHWIETGKKAGLSEKTVKRIIAELKDHIPEVLSSTADIIPSGFPENIADSIINGIKSTAEIL